MTGHRTQEYWPTVGNNTGRPGAAHWTPYANTLAQYERGLYPIPTAVSLAIQMVVQINRKKEGKR